MTVPQQSEPSQTAVIYRPGLGFAAFPQRHRGPSPRLLMLLGLPLLAALLIVPLILGLRPPTSLDEAVLSGARGPGCLRLVLASDHSGSMTELQAARDQAIRQLFAWAPRNLRSNDEIAVVTFAGHATTTLQPTAVEELQLPDAATPDPTNTRLLPVLDQVTTFSATRCRTALVVMGDGRFSDLPTDDASGTQALYSAGVDEVALLVPGRTDTPEDWQRVFPSAPAQVFDGRSPEATGLVIAEQLARWTGQGLTRSTRPSTR
ncbi:MAG: hypothetical protein GX454_11605 [Brooklawnia sp.]|nr:hypothetical protein [Brooklawnia sp.]